MTGAGRAAGVVRVVTYNIHLGGRGGAPLTEVVRRLDPDVLLVNECPKVPLVWSRQCRRLARAWDLEPVAGGRPAGSNLVLAAPGTTVVEAGSVRLPQPRWAPRRGIAWARLRVRGVALAVVSCHLGLDRARRVAEVERVLEVAGRLDGTVVVAGDLNEPPRGSAWARLRAAGLVDAGADGGATFPSHDPARRIDALLVRGLDDTGLTVVRRGEVDLPADLLAAASDHRPVVVDLAAGTE